jgi:hypothetical protein
MGTRGLDSTGNLTGYGTISFQRRTHAPWSPLPWWLLVHFYNYTILPVPPLPSLFPAKRLLPVNNSSNQHLLSGSVETTVRAARWSWSSQNPANGDRVRKSDTILLATNTRPAF